MERSLRSLVLLAIAPCLWAAPADAQVQRATVRAGEVLAWPDRHVGEVVELVGEVEGVRSIPGGLELTLSNRRRWIMDAAPEARLRVRLADPVNPVPFVVGRLFRISGIVGAVEAGEAVPLLVEGRGVEALDPVAAPGSPAGPPPVALPPIESRPEVVPAPYPVYVPVPVPRWPGYPWWRPPGWRPDPVAPWDPAPPSHPRSNPPDPARPNAPAAGPPPASTPSVRSNPPRPAQPGAAEAGPAAAPSAPPRAGGSRPRWIKPEAVAPGGPSAGRPAPVPSTDKDKQ